jgi:hypothetical protein
VRSAFASDAGLDALFHFNADGTVVPFVAAGFAGMKTDNGSTGMPDHGRGMFDYGAGVKWFLSDTVAVRGDVRQMLFTERGDSRTNMEYTIGLSFLLGAEKKTVAAAPLAKDTEAPDVVCTNPGNGVTGWAIDRNITATFSEEMDRDTLTSSAFTVKKGTTTVPGKVTYAGLNAAFKPNNDLEKGTVYTATIAAGVKGIAVACDITKEADLERLARTAVDKFGKLDVAINFAGVNMAPPIAEVTREALVESC